jgi:hypothetical protein
MQIWPINNGLELFLELAPAVGVQLVPTTFDWRFQGALGVRFWF